MNRDVESALRRIDAVAKTLNQSSDQLSQKIVEIESALNHYKLGIWAWLDKPVQEEPDSDDSGRYRWRVKHDLGYGKIREKWGLLIHTYPDYDPETTDPIFLKDASREIRVLAVDRIPELLERISEKAAELSEKIKDRAELADQIAASLTKRA